MSLYPSEQDRPLDPDSYRQHALLLKSMHCCRPVRHQGLNKFVRCVTANQSGGGIEMTVYLAGQQGGIDASEIEITTNTPAEKDTDQ